MKYGIPITLLCAILTGCNSTALKEAVDAEKADTSKSAEAVKTGKFEKIIAESTQHKGLFDFYRNKKTGEMYMAVKPEQLGREFIYTVITRDGAREGGHFRGNYREQSVLSIRQHFDRLEFIAENTHFHFDPENPLSKASDANILPAVRAVEKVVAKQESSGAQLIKVNKLFLSEQLHQIKATPHPSSNGQKQFALGKLSADKSKIYDLKTYPENADVFVDYVYENPAPAVKAKEDVTDSRYVSIRMQHSFIAMPDDGYKPRKDDYRVGYFSQKKTDLTTTSHTPYQDVINRWNLVKKDPTADVSEPVKPIVWWIENTTPYEYRELIHDAVLAWNPAFEKAGFKNALQVKIQPDDAEWDAGDIRYNVIRYVSSPQPPFGGYGPSFTNPRTGQIIGSDIILEHTFLTNRLRTEKLLADLNHGSNHEQHSEAEPTLLCSLGHDLQLGRLFGAYTLDTTASGHDATAEQMLRDSAFYLVLHEVGHTLGLNHNMKASQLLSFKELFDPAVRKSGIIAGSVMDYPAINVAPPGQQQTLFYNINTGPYDDWAIIFGYSDDMDDAKKRKAHLALSTRPELTFGNDADDMRAPGVAIDPRINIFDHSNEAVKYATERFKLIDRSRQQLLTRYTVDGESLQELHNAYLILLKEWKNSANVVSRYVGGVEVNRADVGQSGAKQPFKPLSLKQQKQAMTALRNHVFAPDVFASDAQLYASLQQQRRGFDFFGSTEDPKLHAMKLTVQQGVLTHLMHPNVLQRLTDTRLYGNEYSVLGMLTDLTNAVFLDDLSARHIDTGRQNLQADYVKRLLAVATSDVGNAKSAYDSATRSAALHNLKRVTRWLSKRRSAGSTEAQAHRQYLSYLITKGLDKKA